MVISVGECGDQKTNYEVLLVGVNSTSVDQVLLNQTIVSVAANS